MAHVRLEKESSKFQDFLTLNLHVYVILVCIVSFFLTFH